MLLACSRCANDREDALTAESLKFENEREEQGAMNRALTSEEAAAKSDVEGRLDVGGAVAVEAGGGNGLGEDDADGDEDGAGARSEGHGDFDA